MATSWAAPVPIQPVTPDYHLCKQDYGRSLSYIECVRAASTLRMGDDPFIYSIDAAEGSPSGNGPLTLPIYKKYGSLRTIRPCLVCGDLLLH